MSGLTLTISVPLLPLREKVSAKRTDEGAHRLKAFDASICDQLVKGWRDPSSGPFGTTFSRKGRRSLGACA
jgi:hypothetical protein